MKLKLLWFVSFVATLGSLYFSEVRLFNPCNLCWYQRILMYPIAITGIVAVITNNKKFVYYILPLSVTGMFTSLFHYLKQKVAWFNEATSTCTVGVPCSGQYVNWFGFITIPFMALIAFLIINVLAFLILKEKNK